MITFPRIVRAEWTKLSALRSTWIVLLSVVVLTIGVAGAAGRHAHTARLGDTFLGVDLFSLLLGVFGILMITGEYGSGLIRATFAAVPRRVPVLAAKAVVLLLVALPVMAVAATGALFANRLLAGGAPVEPGALRTTIGATVAPIGLALLGLGLGALVRHTAAAIAAYVLSMLVLPALLQAVLSDRLGEQVVRYVPVAAAQGLYAVNNPFRMLSPGLAALVLLAWAAAALTAGALTLWRRDP
jgi:ABC-2 type transport system permease protein